MHRSNPARTDFALAPGQADVLRVPFVASHAAAAAIVIITVPTSAEYGIA